MELEKLVGRGNSYRWNRMVRPPGTRRLGSNLEGIFGASTESASITLGGGPSLYPGQASPWLLI